MTQRQMLWLAIPGLVFNSLLTALLLSEAWENPGLPIGSECCGWAYQSWENYRFMVFGQAGWLMAVSLAALRLRHRKFAPLLLVYSAPVLALASTRLFVTLP